MQGGTGQRVKWKSAKAVGSNPTMNAIFFFFFFFFFLLFILSFFLLMFKHLISSMLHKTLFANYDSACTIVKFKSSLRQIKLQVFYEFKLTQFHVYKAYNLSLPSLDFTFCLSIICA